MRYRDSPSSFSVMKPFLSPVEGWEDVSAGEEWAVERAQEEWDSVLVGGTDPDWD